MKYLILDNDSNSLYRFQKELMERLFHDGNEIYAVVPFEEFVDELLRAMEHLHLEYPKQAHVSGFPSYHEGMANVLLESAAMGRPLITSNIHSCMEAVLEGETGIEQGNQKNRR